MEYDYWQPEPDPREFDFSMFDFIPDMPIGIPDGSIFEGMVPGGLTSEGIPPTQEEINAIGNLPAINVGSGAGGGGAGGGSNLLKSITDYISNNQGKVGLMAALAALGALSKAPPSGGGVKKAYKGPAQQLTRTITQGRYGPIAQYAAQGGIMHAYAHGGQVKPIAMEDGGFVMTKRAVDGAGGPQGIQALLPGARPIHGPGTGTSDSIPAYIQGRNGTTPARVSNGEAYVPRRAQPPGGTRELYAMMRQLERRA